MIGLDTNIIVRYLVQDDPVQSAKANDLLESKLSEKEPGFISLVTLIEVLWVLDTCYKQSKIELVRVIRTLVATRQLIIEKSELAYKAATLYEASNADFSDAVIALLAFENRCTECFSFDKKAQSVGMTLL